MYGHVRNGFATLFIENFYPNNFERNDDGVIVDYKLPDKYLPVRNVYTKMFWNAKTEMVENSSVTTISFMSVNYNGYLSFKFIETNYTKSISLIGTVTYPVRYTE